MSPKIPFDLTVIADVFKLQRNEDCEFLKKWLSASYQLNEYEVELLRQIHTEMRQSAEYLNEEEIKIRLIAPLLLIANLDQGDKIRVFFERSLAAESEGYQLSVICDCMVAASTIFKTPTRPYFFLQEFKKAKGEKRDPEAQMLVAMLAAQKLNADGKPIYGGYLIGSMWHFSVLVGQMYCSSRPYYATQKEDLKEIAFALKHLKEVVLEA